jgi:glycosyltransferase involved in cell wall biosynthesis
VPRAASWAWLRRFHNAACSVMVSTPGLKTELEERGFQSVALWPRGVDTDLFRPRPECDSVFDLPRPIFLNVGRLAVEKNIEAFLSQDLPGSKVLVGDGPSRGELERKYPGVHFTGALHGEELAKAYASADVFVFPSLTDTYGLVLLEAMASGLPVAAFPAPGPRDVIGDAPAGALDDDLRKACLRALDIPRETAREFALGFSWEASARMFLSNVTEVAPQAVPRLSRRRRSALFVASNARRAARAGARLFQRRRA